MIQEIITYLIIAGAVLITIYKTYRFFSVAKTQKCNEANCSVDMACANCAFKAECNVIEDGRTKNSKH